MENVINPRYKSDNQLFLIMLDPLFQKLAENEKIRLLKVIKTLNGKKRYPFKTTHEVKENIGKYLFDKKLPSIWVETLFSFIKNEEVIPPIDSGIDIFVGEQSLSESGGEITLIGHKDGRLPAKESTLSIVMAARISIDRLIRFVRKNADSIKYWQKALGLPPYNETPWKKTELAFGIIMLKDKEKMSYNQISNKLTENEDLSEEELNYLGNAENIKSLYRRYKKYFFSK